MMTQQTSPILVLMLRHAGKNYSGSPALINAALDLLPGEVHALMGENGAGRSGMTGAPISMWMGW